MPVCLSNAALAACVGDPRRFPDDALPQVALSGRSNVGKSSLINALLGRRALARVSASPGKTVTVNFYAIDRRFYLVDLPGYGYARRSDAERASLSALADGYFTKHRRPENLRLVLQLIDLKVGPTADDRTMLRYLAARGLPFAVAATKADKLGPTARRAALEALAADPDIPAGTTVLPFSALSGEGCDKLRSLILEAVGLA